MLLKNKTKDEKEKLKQLFKNTKKTIRDDYNHHRKTSIEPEDIPKFKTSQQRTNNT